FSATGGLTLADNLTVTAGGVTITSGALAVNSDSITSDGSLIINATTTDIQDALTADSLTLDTSSLTFSGVATDIITGANEVLTVTPNGTGNVLINPSAGGQAALIVNKTGNNDIFTASASGVNRFSIQTDGKLLASFYTTCTLKTDSNGLVTCGTDNTGGAGTSPFEQVSGGVIVPNNSTVDFLLGGQATSSARFGLTGIAAGTPIATLSASTNNNGLVLSASDARVQSLRNNALTLGGDTTGNISISPLNGGAGSLLTVNALTTNFGGAITGVTTLTASGAIAANGGITFDAATDTLSAFTLSGTLDANANLIQNIGNAGTDFSATGGLTLADNLTVTAG
ncbi:MAG: hypothetical protein AAB504_02865, partial [Patescibacteria group bacterium]